MCFHNAKRGRRCDVPLWLCKSGVAGSFLASATALQIMSSKDVGYLEGVKLMHMSVVGGKISLRPMGLVVNSLFLLLA
ncbi:MAG: hypothetical protein ACI9OU_000983 [Candidatus Promineifilaceae bacterium]|jgi:hypothetical protein